VAIHHKSNTRMRAFRGLSLARLPLLGVQSMQRDGFSRRIAWEFSSRVLVVLGSSMKLQNVWSDNGSKRLSTRNIVSESSSSANGADCSNIPQLLFQKSRNYNAEAIVPLIPDCIDSMNNSGRMWTQADITYSISAVKPLLLSHRKVGIQLLDAIISKLEQNTEQFSTATIARCLSILVFFNKLSGPSQRLVEAVTNKLNESDGRFLTSEISQSLYALYTLKNPTDNVQIDNLLTALAGRIRNAVLITIFEDGSKIKTNDYDAHQIGMCFYGLHNLGNVGADGAVFDRVVRELISKVRDCESVFELQHIAAITSSLSAIQSVLGGNHVDELTTILKQKITEAGSTLVVDAVSFSSCVHNLRDMTPKPTVADLLYELNGILFARPSMMLSPAQIAACLQGLERLGDSKEGATMMKLLTGMISHCNEPFGPQEICVCLTSLKFRKSNSPQVKPLIAALTEQLVELNARTKSELCPGSGESVRGLTATELGSVYIGLRNMTGEEAEVRKLLQSLQPMLHNRKQHMTGPAISQILFSLSNKAQTPEVLAIIEEVASIVRNANDTVKMNGQGVASALYGLRKFRSNTSSIKTILRYLAALLENLHRDYKKIGPTEFRMCLSGMQSMSNNTKEVNAIIGLLNQLIDDKAIEMKAADLIPCFIGIKCMNANTAEVRTLLMTLSEALSSIPAGQMNLADIVTCLYGLRGMSSEHVEVRSLLRALSELLAANHEPMTGQVIGNILAGIKNMSYDSSGFANDEFSDAVSSHLAVIEAKLQNTSSIRLSAQNLFGALSGLQYKRRRGDSHSNDECIESIIAFITKQLARLHSEGKWSAADNDKLRQAVSTVHFDGAQELVAVSSKL
jgi:hypothetical protein